MRPLRIEFPGAVFHVTSRGNERKLVFRDDEDRYAFVAVLARAVARWRWIVHAYCLMGNHYHLLIETPEPNLSRGMRQLNGEYTQSFNRRHRRSGHLFQGRFHAVLVEKETHLLELCRYVVLNPVRARLAREPAEWLWSSYRATAGRAKAPAFLRTDWILAQFSPRRAARALYEEFVARGRARGKGLAPAVRHGLWVGREEFGALIQEHLEKWSGVREHRLTTRMAHRPPLKEILAPEAIGDRDGLVCAVGRAYLEARYTQREIAAHLQVHYMTVSRLVRECEKEKG